MELKGPKRARYNQNQIYNNILPSTGLNLP